MRQPRRPESKTPQEIGQEIGDAIAQAIAGAIPQPKAPAMPEEIPQKWEPPKLLKVKSVLPEEGTVKGGTPVTIEFEEDLPYSEMTLRLGGMYVEIAELNSPKTLLIITPESPEKKVGIVNFEIEFYRRGIPLDKPYRYTAP